MPIRSGRLDKRARVAMPVWISSPEEPAAIERTSTENVSSLGIRVLLRRAREMNERLSIKSVDGTCKYALA